METSTTIRKQVAKETREVYEDIVQLKTQYFLNQILSRSNRKDEKFFFQ